MKEFEIFEQRYAITVLIQIFENPGINKTELYALEDNKGETSKSDRISALVKEGLVIEERTKHKNPVVKLYLTLKGERLAQHFQGIKLIQNGESPEPPTNHGTPTKQGHTIKESE